MTPTVPDQRRHWITEVLDVDPDLRSATVRVRESKYDGRYPEFTLQFDAAGELVECERVRVLRGAGVSLPADVERFRFWGDARLSFLGREPSLKDALDVTTALYLHGDGVAEPIGLLTR